MVRRCANPSCNKPMPNARSYQRYCTAVECQRYRRRLNQARASARQKELGIKHNGGTNVPAKEKPKTKIIDCNRCLKPFRTRLTCDAHSIPVYRTCPECRKYVNDVLRMAGAWG